MCDWGFANVRMKQLLDTYHVSLCSWGIGDITKLSKPTVF